MEKENVNRQPDQLAQQAAGAVKNWLGSRAEELQFVMIAGSGFKSALEQLDVIDQQELDAFPGFSKPRVPGHGAKALLLKDPQSQKFGLAYTGRLHFYERYTTEQVVFGLDVAAQLGIQTAILTNAAGSLDEALKPQTFVLIRDHINFTGQTPLFGLADPFISTDNLYDRELRERFRQKKDLQEAVYAGVLGPSYETPAECRFFEQAGCQMIGMSTVFEVLKAKYWGMRVLTLSFVANYCANVKAVKLTHQDVLNATKDLDASFLEVLHLAIEISCAGGGK